MQREAWHQNDEVAVSKQARKSHQEMLRLVSGHQLGHVREATINLLAALQMQDAERWEEVEQSLTDTDTVLREITRRQWKVERSHKPGKA